MQYICVSMRFFIMRKKKVVSKKVPMKRKKKVVTKPRKSKVIKTRNGGTWTESQFFSAIRSALRTKFRYWKPMATVLAKASRPYKGPNKLQKKEFQCAKCKKWFKRTLVEIDHIVECGSLRTYDDIVPFIKRLTEENEEAYQILCKNECHKAKTLEYKTNKKNNG